MIPRRAGDLDPHKTPHIWIRQCDRAQHPCWLTPGILRRLRDLRQSDRTQIDPALLRQADEVDQNVGQLLGNSGVQWLVRDQRLCPIRG